MHEKVQAALTECAVPYEERSFSEPFETTDRAAEMLQTDKEHIAKTMVFQSPTGSTVTIIASGTARVDNRKFKERFDFHPTMMKPDALVVRTGYESGSVSPIGIAARRDRVYMDASLLRYRGETVYPSGGTDRCAIAISPEALYQAAQCSGEVDVCKEPIGG